MHDQLILLPGWAFGPTALQPLCEALNEQAPWLSVAIEPLPESDEPNAWLDELDQRVPSGSWLAGWSLGGMLATQLAARRGDACRGLITIASNPCFRERHDWASAMPAEIFDTFYRAFQLGPQETLQRFSLLCSRGGFDPRTLARQLQVGQSQSPVDVLDAGLQLLAQLDGRAALQAYVGPQLHLFAGRDALVPVAAADGLLDQLPDVEIEVMEGASHGLPLERPDDVAAALVAFLEHGRE